VSKEAFFGANFCVLLYPDSSQAEMSGKAIIPYLKRLGVECLDFTALIDMRQERFTIKGDDHPSAAAHKAVAEALVEALRLAR
jgi:beta-lactamase superfamily II metal-dependent hydrolase